MVDELLFVVRNENHAECRGCKGIHDYVSRGCVPISFTMHEILTRQWPRQFGMYHRIPDGMPTVRVDTIAKKVEDQVA